MLATLSRREEVSPFHLNPKENFPVFIVLSVYSTCYVGLRCGWLPKIWFVFFFYLMPSYKMIFLYFLFAQFIPPAT